MLEPKIYPAYDEAVTRLDPGMPNYVGTEDELLAALELGDADIEAGRTVAFDDVATELRQNYRKD